MAKVFEVFRVGGDIPGTIEATGQVTGEVEAGRRAILMLTDQHFLHAVADDGGLRGASPLCFVSEARGERVWKFQRDGRHMCKVLRAQHSGKSEGRLRVGTAPLDRCNLFGGAIVVREGPTSPGPSRREGDGGALLAQSMRRVSGGTACDLPNTFWKVRVGRWASCGRVGA